MKLLLSIAVFAFLSSPANAWDGYHWESGSYVEIDKGNLVREGRDIEIYDYGTGEYRDVTVGICAAPVRASKSKSTIMRAANPACLIWTEQPSP